MAEVENTTEPSFHKRWYDDNTHIVYLIGTLPDLDDDLRTLLGRSIMRRISKACSLNRSLKSIGGDKVMALYKAQNKDRSYDKDPVLYKLMNHLMVLPDDDQAHFGQEGAHFVRIINQYIADSKANDIELTFTELEELSWKFVEFGVASLQDAIAAQHPQLQFAAIVTEDDTGMRVTN